MEFLRNIVALLILTFMTGMFFGCTDKKEKELVEFVKLVEHRNYETINKVLRRALSNDYLCQVACRFRINNKLIATNSCDCSQSNQTKDPLLRKIKLIEEVRSELYTTINLDTLLLKLENELWNDNNKIQSYLTVNYLFLKSLIYIEDEKYLESESCMIYAFHLAEKNNLETDFPYTYYQTLNGLQFVWARNEKNPNLQKRLNQLVLEGAKKYNLEDLENDALYRNIDLWDFNDSTYLNQIFTILKNSEYSIETKENIASTIIKNIYIHENIELFELCKSIALDENRKPNFYFYLVDLLIIADSYSYEYMFEEADYYIGQAEKMINEKMPNNPWINNYLAETKKTYYEFKYANNQKQSELDSALHYLEKMSFEIEKIFVDKSSYHYNDVLVDHVIDLMYLLYQWEGIPRSEQAKILHKNHYAKNQELKFQSQENKVLHNGEKTKFGNINKGILDIYLNTNDLTNLDDITNPKYERLYELVDERNNIRAQVKSESTFETYPINAEDVFKLVDEKDVEIIEYIMGVNETALYHLSSEGMKISFIDNEELDLLVSQLLKYINKKEKELDVQGLKELILPFDFRESTKEVIILKSGLLERVPFVLFDLSVKVRYSNDLNEVLKNDDIIIDSRNFWIQSFSNKESLKDRSPKDFPELENGFKSSNLIAEKLGVEAKNRCAGESSTFKMFKKGCEKEGLHLIAHGISDEDVKNKNYLIFRRPNNKYQKVSTVDLDYLPSYPKFVFLDACSTGKGKIEVGEGSYSIGRVFLKNGSSTIIKTLWKINDETAGLFSDFFYTNWINGDSAIEALRKAQIKLKESGLLAYDYAPFVLEGNPNIYLSKN